MKLKFKTYTRAAILFVVLACAFSTKSFAQCSFSVSNAIALTNLDFNSHTEATPIKVTRTESSVRTIYNSVGPIHNYDYQAIVSDGDFPKVTFVDYDYNLTTPVKVTVPWAISGFTNCGPDVRINSTAEAAIVIFVDNNGSGTSYLYYQLYTSNINSTFGHSVSWAPSGTKVAIFSSSSIITETAIDIDQKDEFVITWQNNGEVFGTAGTYVHTTFTWSGNNVQITEATHGGYIRPSDTLGHGAGAHNTFEGGDVSIYSNIQNDTVIVSFLMRDLDNSTNAADNFGVIVYQMQYSDLYAGRAKSPAAFTRENDGNFFAPLYKPSSLSDDITDGHIGIDASQMNRFIDYFNFCAAFTVKPSGSSNTYVKTYTHYNMITAATAKNRNLTILPDIISQVNSGPSVAFTHDCITVLWNYTSSCATYIQPIFGAKINLVGTTPSHMGTNDVFCVNTGSGCTSAYRCASVADPELDYTQTYSDKDFYTYYEDNSPSPCAVGFKNQVWGECRGYFQIAKRDYGYQIDTLSSQYVTSKINVYPIPADGKITIDFGTTEYDGLTYLSINTITGVDIQNSILEGNVSQQVDVSNLDNGIYFLYFKHNNETFVRKVIIKHNL